jgi:hypothetical protein
VIFGFLIVLCGHDLSFSQTVRGGAGLGLHDEKFPDPRPAPYLILIQQKTLTLAPHRAAGRKKKEKTKRKK